MLDRTILVTDDRRTSVPLLRLHAFRKTLPQRNRRAHVLARRLAWFMILRARRLTPSRILFELLLGASILVAFIGPFFFLGILGPLAILGVFVATPAAMNYFSRETGERKHRREFAASYVAEGICASCAYPLRGLPDEHDHCHTCPECGAAWHAHRIVAPIWDDDAPSLPRGPTAPLRWLRWQESAAARTTGDAQGRLVPIADIRLTHWTPDKRASLDPQRLANLRRNLWRMGLTWRALVLIAATIPASALISFAAMWLRGSMHPGLLEIAAMALAAAITLLLLLSAILGGRFASLRRVADAITAAGLCPTCGSPLSTARPLIDHHDDHHHHDTNADNNDTDHAHTTPHNHTRVVCTHCAATWRNSVGMTGGMGGMLSPKP